MPGRFTDLLRRTIASAIICGTLVSSGTSALADDSVGKGPLAKQLIGTWRIIKFTDTDASGQTRYPYGEHPSGYLIYDNTGHVSVQGMRDPAIAPFASGDDEKGTDAEVRSAYDAYVAYYGTYHVDEGKSVVTHVVEGSLHPSYIGTEQARPFKLNGDVLVIDISVAEGHFYREFHRVK
jgi:lipocalin-like protein